ncbi:tetratricopeptide repeat protein [Aquariibacter albus]|uniref:Pilus assembly protein n=1 Tax=Aquariibacter albus TaxID=2759899 RepID=A0A839HRK1_9BURK|nr:pilus assembly protein [Aquariibacter albus]MBB1162100.1 pilus assembly protein [Aquariibacter albus]
MHPPLAFPLSRRLLAGLLLAAAPVLAAPGIGPGTGRSDGAEPGVDRPATDPRSAYLAVLGELRATGQHYAVLAHLQSFEAEFGESPDTLMLRADALRATGQGEAAGRVYTRLLTTPRAAAGHHGLGLLAGARGDMTQAATLLGRAVALEPTNPVLQSDLGYALIAGQRLGEARGPIFTAAQLAPNDPRILANLALYHASVGDRTAAESVLARPGISEASRQIIRGMLAPPAAPAPRSPEPPSAEALNLQFDYRLPQPRKPVAATPPSSATVPPPGASR